MSPWRLRTVSSCFLSRTGASASVVLTIYISRLCGTYELEQTIEPPAVTPIDVPGSFVVVRMHLIQVLPSSYAAEYLFAADVESSLQGHFASHD